MNDERKPARMHCGECGNDFNCPECAPLQSRLSQKPAPDTAARVGDDAPVDYEYRLAVAYQIVGTFLDYVGAHDTAQGQNILDYLNGDADARDPLPFTHSILASIPIPTGRAEALEALLAAEREKFTMHTAHVAAWFGALLEEFGVADEGVQMDVATACTRAMDEAKRLRALSSAPTQAVTRLTIDAERVERALAVRYPDEWPNDTVFSTVMASGITFADQARNEMTAELMAAFPEIRAVQPEI